MRSFSYFYDHDYRPTYTGLKVGGTTQRLNTMQYNELSKLETNGFRNSLDGKYQRSIRSDGSRVTCDELNLSIYRKSMQGFQKPDANKLPLSKMGKGICRQSTNQTLPKAKSK